MAGKAKDGNQPMTDQEILDFLKNEIVEKVKNGEINLKVGDLLKILELQKKLSTDKDAEDQFWQMIEQIRQEELKDAE